MMNRTIGTGGLVMMLVVALAAIGIGIALWSKVLTIHGVVRTGTVNAEFVKVFTDDDDAIDDIDKDSWDDPAVSNNGDPCLIHVGQDESPLGNDKDLNDGRTSCDPAQTGRDPKRHYDKDVARCDAIAVPDGQDNEPQPGSQRALVALTNVYPSYHCTAWFDIQNIGSIPVLLHSLAIQGKPAAPCASGASTPYDLNGDGRPDIEICVSEIVCPTGQRCEPQIDPKDIFQFNLDIHVMQTAPQGAGLTFDAALCLHQWNEETGSCPAVAPGCGSGTVDICVDGDGIATAGPGAFSIAAGDAILPASAGGNPSGLDLIDRGVINGLYEAGDDLMVEDPIGTPTCPSAARNAVYDANAAAKDCVVLDPDGSLVDGDFVTCDAGGGCGLSFRDDDADGRYDEGEDLVVDVNGNGVFD